MTIQAIKIRTQCKGKVNAIIARPVVSAVAALIKAAEVSLAKP